jgi:two-component system NarL family response regulator
MSIRVILAEDHPVVRSGIKNLLGSSPDIEVVGEADDGEKAYQLVQEHNPDVLLLDLELPVMDGVELAEKMAKENNPVKILVLSSYSDREYITEMLSLGINGYLLKDEVPQNILNAIRGVSQGEQGWVSREVAALLGKISTQEIERDPLTPREMEVLGLVVEGQINREIAFNLDISEKTVEKHLHNVFKKLDVSSRVEAAVLAVEENLIPSE